MSDLLRNLKSYNKDIISYKIMHYTIHQRKHSQFQYQIIFKLSNMHSLVHCSALLSEKLKYKDKLNENITNVLNLQKSILSNPQKPVHHVSCTTAKSFL